VDFAEAAARFREATARAEASLARDCARAGANEFLAELHVTTPVESGALRASERVWRVSGGGAHAEAIVGPNIIYARFRNDGGTIRVRRAKVLTDGTRFFGRSVTQHGAHYMEKAEAGAQGTIQAAMAAILSDYLESL
jgi:Bacteriophage HK97-gp10, putative tail-component